MLAAAVAALVAGLAWQDRREAAAAPRFETQAATRGPLTVNVTANGTLQPITQVNIGSELSGTVSRVLVDVNDGFVPTPAISHAILTLNAQGRNADGIDEARRDAEERSRHEEPQRHRRGWSLLERERAHA